MFDLRINSLDLYSVALPQASKHAALLNSAVGLFNTARRAGLAERVAGWLLGRSRRLLNLSTIPCSQVRHRHYAGIRCVSISRICGSVNRTRDFDRHFHPLADRLRDRWVSVAMARCQGISIPAVSLVQVGDCYFVEDGHHRLSVACALGESAIDAEVTIWEVSGPLPWERRSSQSAPQPAFRPA